MSQQRRGLGSSPLRGVMTAGKQEAEDEDTTLASIREKPALPVQFDDQIRRELDSVFALTQPDETTSNRRQVAVSSAETLLRLQRRDRENYLERGRIIRALSDALEPDEFKRFIGSKLLVPMGEKTAIRLRIIAERMAERGVSDKDMPNDWTVSYALMSLPNDRFKQAVAAGLLRPTTTRRDIDRFKRDNRPRIVSPELPESKIQELQREREQINRELEEYRNKAKRLAARLRLINARLEAGGGAGS